MDVSTATPPQALNGHRPGTVCTFPDLPAWWAGATRTLPRFDSARFLDAAYAVRRVGLSCKGGNAGKRDVSEHSIPFLVGKPCPTSFDAFLWPSFTSGTKQAPVFQSARTLQDRLCRSRLSFRCSNGQDELGGHFADRVLSQGL